MSPEVRLLVGPCAAFWVTLLAYRFGHGDDSLRGRFLAGLVLGALAAHLGWGLLHFPEIVDRPRLLAEPTGFTWLAVPAGFWAAAVGLRSGAQRRFLDAALASLPAGLGAAKLGCHLAGCCLGILIDGVRQPMALFEAAALLALFVFLNSRRQFRRRPGQLAGAALLGLAGVRGLSEPWRAPSPLGDPWLPISVLVGFWVLAAFRLMLPVDPPRESHLKGT